AQSGRERREERRWFAQGQAVVCGRFWLEGVWQLLGRKHRVFAGTFFVLRRYLGGRWKPGAWSEAAVDGFAHLLCACAARRITSGDRVDRASLCLAGGESARLRGFGLVDVGLIYAGQFPGAELRQRASNHRV